MLLTQDELLLFLLLVSPMWLLLVSSLWSWLLMLSTWDQLLLLPLLALTWLLLALSLWGVTVLDTTRQVAAAAAATVEKLDCGRGGQVREGRGRVCVQVCVCMRVC